MFHKKRWRSLLTICMVVSLALILALQAHTSQLAHAATSFTSTVITPLGHPWLGFGTNEYPQPRNQQTANQPGSTTTPPLWTANSNLFNLTTSRLSYMQPGLTRINFYRDWFNPSGTVGSYNWSTLAMQNAFQILTYYKSQGYVLQIGIWHTLLGGTDSESVYTSTSFATLEADLMNELINVQGYTNIHYYAGINEPDCSYMGFSLSDWQTHQQNLIAAFQAKGLSTSLLVGDDTCSYDSAWTPVVAQRNSSEVSAYEYHYYPQENDITSDNVESTLASQVSQIDGYDTSNKPVYLSEMGVSDPDRGTNPPINSYAYGLDMIDYGVQAARAGEAGAQAWCLDGFDFGKNCGMWDSSGNNGGTTLRSWFYTWSLLSRYFPPNASIYTLSEPNNMRIVGAKVVSGSNAHWTFTLVNRDSSNSQTITLQVPGWGSGTFNEYLYSQSNSPTDSNGFPVPTASISTASGSLSAGVTVTVPASSAVVLTTLDGSPLPSQSSITDNLNNWSMTFSHSTNWVLDNTNPQYFNGDTSRAKRTSNTPETITWHNTDISNFAATVYFCCSTPYSGTVSFATSPDGQNWTTLTSTNSSPVSTGNGGAWYSTVYSPATTMPAGTNYLQITFANDTNVWSPQLGQMVLNLVPLGHTIWLQAAANGDYASAWLGDPNTPLEARSTHVLQWEEFQWIDLGNDEVALQAAANGDYVSAWLGDPNTPLEARSTHIQGWETFWWGVVS